MAEPFKFAAHAATFDQHIGDSIPALDFLRDGIANLSRRFVQPQTSVIDMGCSAGTILRAVRDANQAEIPAVEYLGIDVEPLFEKHWATDKVENLRFHVGDVRQQHFQNTSLTISTFTLQFIPESDRLSLLKRVYDGLVEGGALIIAEKVLAESARFQDIFAFDYYDFKRRVFSAEEILNKEHGLRRQMHLWSKSQLVETLQQAGFQAGDMDSFWQSYLFVGFVAIKQRPVRAARPRAA